MWRFVVLLVIACAHGPVTKADAIKGAQSWARANPRHVSFNELADCDWTAELDRDIWAVRMQLGPRSGIGTDCYCARTFYVRADTGKPICMLCGGGFAIHSMEPGSCERFLPPEK
jgi:hypothetical protein